MSFQSKNIVFIFASVVWAEPHTRQNQSKDLLCYTQSIVYIILNLLTLLKKLIYSGHALSYTSSKLS